MTYFKQCSLSKPLGNSTQHQIAWIPEYLAHVGQMVKTHIQGDIWSNGWRVDEVGARVPEDYVSRHERDHLTQARASDAVRDPDGNGK